MTAAFSPPFPTNPNVGDTFCGWRGTARCGSARRRNSSKSDLPRERPLHADPRLARRRRGVLGRRRLRRRGASGRARPTWLAAAAAAGRLLQNRVCGGDGQGRRLGDSRRGRHQHFQEQPRRAGPTSSGADLRRPNRRRRWRWRERRQRLRLGRSRGPRRGSATFAAPGVAGFTRPHIQIGPSATDFATAVGGWLALGGTPQPGPVRRRRLPPRSGTRPRTPELAARGRRSTSWRAGFGTTHFGGNGGSGLLRRNRGCISRTTKAGAGARQGAAGRPAWRSMAGMDMGPEVSMIEIKLHDRRVADGCCKSSPARRGRRRPADHGDRGTARTAQLPPRAPRSRDAGSAGRGGTAHPVSDRIGGSVNPPSAVSLVPFPAAVTVIAVQ